MRATAGVAAVAATETRTESCPECSGAVRPEGTERVCTECGLVVATDQIDRGPEWRAFDDDNGDSRRCKRPRDPTHHDYGLSTRIGKGVDGAGNTIDGGKRRRLSRLRTRNARGRFDGKRDRNLAYVFGQIKRIVSQLELGRSVQDHACGIAREAQAEDLYQGRDLDRIAPAAVYAACRVRGITRTTESISEVAHADAGGIEQAYGVLNVQLGLPAAVIAPSDWIEPILDGLPVGNRLRPRAMALARRAEDTPSAFVGSSPSGIAAGCVWLASEAAGLGITQAQVGNAADVSATTVRYRAHDLQSLDSAGVQAEG